MVGVDLADGFLFGREARLSKQMQLLCFSVTQLCHNCYTPIINQSDSASDYISFVISYIKWLVASKMHTTRENCLDADINHYGSFHFCCICLLAPPFIIDFHHLIFIHHSKSERYPIKCLYIHSIPVPCTAPILNPT